MTDNSLSSTRPYLIRAMHEWMTDNNQTPLVVIDAVVDGVIVPLEHVKEGRIVLNVAWSATRNLELGNDIISFQARFGGVAHSVAIPIGAVQGIYARESGQGMVLQDESGLAESAGNNSVEAGLNSNDDADDPKPRPSGPNLRVVK
ncbi:MAG: ClpXP protease specificity-enhancing factor [Gammaproteobacteria bacterium]|nr:MAG: ClpXP protease specificity-enhancing factor [Gammaproteobacteria bacterium]